MYIVGLHTHNVSQKILPILTCSKIYFPKTAKF